MPLQRCFWLCLSMMLFLSTAAFAAPKKIADLFPGLPNIDGSQVFSRSSPQYLELISCQNAEVKSTSCIPNGEARFYDFSKTKGIDDSYDFMNRCVGMRGFKRYPKDVKESDYATSTGFGLVLNGTEVDCTGLQNNEVISTQLVACYTRANGVHCGYATACFEGADAKGECAKDYPSEDIFVTRNSAIAASPLPPPTVKCEPKFCHLGMARKATCYSDGTHSPMSPLGSSCATEDGSNIAGFCTDTAFCNPTPPKYYCRANYSSTPSAPDCTNNSVIGTPNGCGTLAQYGACRAGTANYCSCMCTDDATGAGLAW